MGGGGEREKEKEGGGKREKWGGGKRERDQVMQTCDKPSGHVRHLPRGINCHLLASVYI